MKGQLISDWKTQRWIERRWMHRFIKISMTVRYYGRLRRTEGIFVELD